MKGFQNFKIGVDVMRELSQERDYSRSHQQEYLGNILKDLSRNVKIKEDQLKVYNAGLKRPLEYPEFRRPELVKSAGIEITSMVRDNFNKLIAEADKYSALEGSLGNRIPEKQVEDLRNIIFSNRIFMSSTIDHDRSRIEFDVTKNNIIDNWERHYNMSWPTYKKDIISDDNLIAKAGKKVSRHHFLPVRAILIPEGSEIENKIDKGELNLAAPQFFKHHSPNEYQNMIPSIYPKDHLGGLHNDDSIFASIFGPIKLDYHHDQISPDDDTKFKSAVPSEFKAIAIPTFAKQYGYFLEKMQDKIGYQLPLEQKEKIVSFLNDYVKTYNVDNKLTELSYNDTFKNVKFANKLTERVLKKEWESNTGMKWPKNARAEFLIPPFYKPERYEWWMVAPGKKPYGAVTRDDEYSREYEHSRDYDKSSNYDRGLSFDDNKLHKISNYNKCQRSHKFEVSKNNGGKVLEFKR
jgi:hypothetical protein